MALPPHWGRVRGQRPEGAWVWCPTPPRSMYSTLKQEDEEQRQQESTQGRKPGLCKRPGRGEQGSRAAGPHPVRHSQVPSGSRASACPQELTGPVGATVTGGGGGSWRGAPDSQCFLAHRGNGVLNRTVQEASEPEGQASGCCLRGPRLQTPNNGGPNSLPLPLQQPLVRTQPLPCPSLPSLR